MTKKKESLNIFSDLAGSGLLLEILSSITKLSPGIDNIITMALPALACGSNIVLRHGNEQVLRKDKEKIAHLIEDINSVMKQRGIATLKHFTNLDFPIEIYSVVEEIIKEAINAKGKWLRKMAASIIVTIGSNDNPNYMKGKQLCLELVSSLNEIDVKLLLLYQAYQNGNQSKTLAEQKSDQMLQVVKNELLSDDSVYAQTIMSSSIKLSNLGLIRRECSLYPYDDEFKNKKEMLENFIAQNGNETTAHYKEFTKYLYTLV